MSKADRIFGLEPCLQLFTGFKDTVGCRGGGKTRCLGCGPGRKARMNERAKEKAFHVTSGGKETCRRDRQIRAQCLLKSLGLLCDTGQGVGDLAALLRAPRGLHDRAARAATSL